MGRLIICLALAACYGGAFLPLLPYKVGRQELLAVWSVPGICMAALGVIRTGFPGARSVDRYVIGAIGLGLAQLALAYVNEFLPGCGNAGPLNNGPLDAVQIVIAGLAIGLPFLVILVRMARQGAEPRPHDKNLKDE